MHRASVAAVLALLSVATALRNDVEEDIELQAGTENPIVGKKDSYALVKLLGQGAYGSAYLARSSNGEVVVKKISLSTQEAKQSFKTEWDAWNKMQMCVGYPPPNVIHYFEVLQLSASEGAVVMELASGGSLSSLLYERVSSEGARDGVRTNAGDKLITNERKAMELFRQLAAGVKWLAECGVIHKDLKPDNIMLSKKWEEGGILKIIDFGLATVIGSPVTAPVGNMYYNLQQNVAASTWSQEAQTFDDFALGMILAELGTGIPPFFNPEFDYYSMKQGNLQGEKGILYILADRSIYEKGGAGVFTAKKNLADGGKDYLKRAIMEVVGRSLYYLKTGKHFPHASARTGTISQQVNEEDLRTSWLYSSGPAQSLLSSLIQWNANARIDPRNLLAAEWFGSSGAGSDQEPGPRRPSVRPVTQKEAVMPPERVERVEAVQQMPKKPSPAASPAASTQAACQNARKLPSAPRDCKVSFDPPQNQGKRCSVSLSCNGAPAKSFQLHSDDSDGVKVDGCRGPCELA